MSLGESLDVNHDFFHLLFLLRSQLTSGKALLLPAKLIHDDYDVLAYDSCGDSDYDLVRTEETLVHQHFDAYPGIQYAINPNLRPELNSVKVDLTSQTLLPIPCLQGLDLYTLQAILDEHGEALLKFQLTIKRLFMNIQDAKADIQINLFIRELQEHYSILSERYYLEIKSLKSRGYYCCLGFMLLGLTLVLPDAYSKLVSIVLGSSSIKDAITLFQDWKNIDLKLQNVSDYWLPWKLWRSDKGKSKT